MAVSIDSFFLRFCSSSMGLNFNVVSWTLTMTPAPLLSLAVSILSRLASFCFSPCSLNSSAVLVAMVALTWKRLADSLAAISASLRTVKIVEIFVVDFRIWCILWARYESKEVCELSAIHMIQILLSVLAAPQNSSEWYPLSSSVIICLWLDTPALPFSPYYHPFIHSNTILFYYKNKLLTNMYIICPYLTIPKLYSINTQNYNKNM